MREQGQVTQAKEKLEEQMREITSNYEEQLTTLRKKVDFFHKKDIQ